MKLRILYGIIEIEGQHRGNDFPRLLKAHRDLNRVALDSAQVLHVHHCRHNQEPCSVPHFGHSALCGEPCHVEALSWGVKRYFGVELLITGEFDLSNIPQAYRINEHAQFIPCGLTEEFSAEGDFQSLERIERQNEAVAA